MTILEEYDLKQIIFDIVKLDIIDVNTQMIQTISNINYNTLSLSILKNNLNEYI